jgi:hypothetical protein
LLLAFSPPAGKINLTPWYFLEIFPLLALVNGIDECTPMSNVFGVAQAVFINSFIAFEFKKSWALDIWVASLQENTIEMVSRI